MLDDNYLAHHGVKGMKWGVHNAETAARYGESPQRRKLSKSFVKKAVIGMAAVTAVAAVNPSVMAVGANAIGKAIGIAAPIATKKALHMAGNYVGTKAINKAAGKMYTKAKNPKTRKLLKELSEETVSEVIVEHGKEKLVPLLFEDV